MRADIRAFSCRSVVCAELLGMQERVDWKRCAPGKAEETKICNRVRAAFAPFDWSLAEE
jgi:hypothetical protein